ncbi:DNA polymerase III subunit gamma/tau [Actibacterium sp. 188UL27-1]|uniref:DNA polymerase III subunit gamma/tau n=1 Tax=Actibacterium sp. 188UL27-1 TaxID=2786961 RepID=UPI00195E322E|nr:DNA polymerase III subunit gamma/tau [Actibacterium sp. 188UL27-1]MBM7067905.1 DNA polymerase III subunit gamma/tau [Actibacterium sp. 188UL27-1]
MTDQPDGYQVLARKYRPLTFADLVGQDAMVRTLKNAFAADRIAQAFMMTGIRGTGKTTTARIIAKGMNCTGPDGTGGPTTEPCGQCDACLGIAEGRHVDVLEMDAASNTGIDDIRNQVLDSVAYAPSSARYKVYIIDEVHMLSKSAFNALLKTLEEPPAHVKFIFATTEIRKVPVTVLSRCQRFDLRRIEPEDMVALLRRIADAEGGQITDDALALLVRASEGSARDATSLLDQALSQGTAEATADTVRAMLGLADRGRILDLFDMVMRGDAGAALSELSAQYADGADPLAVLRDLAEVTHWLSVTKITPDAADDPAISPDERDRGRTMAEALQMRVLTRTWQMLLKALEEVAAAPNAMMAAEMAIIRLTHVADLPAPEDILSKLKELGPPPPQPPGGGRATPSPAPVQAAAPPPSAPAGTPAGAGPQAALATAPATALARYPTFDSVVELIRANRDVRLLVEVETTLRLAKYTPGRIEFEPAPNTAPDLAQRLGQRLSQMTGTRWAVSVVNEGGAPTIADLRDAEDAARKAEAMEHPMVQAVLKAFPKAHITDIRTPGQIATEAAIDALPEVDDEWDPFEDS